MKVREREGGTPLTIHDLTPWQVGFPVILALEQESPTEQVGLPVIVADKQELFPVQAGSPTILALLQE